ncbi:MAG: tetratricopeptide repeat protein [Cyanobacteria bacterium P01_D01_bin.105]
MSEAEQFTELVNLVEVDPFALIGISLSADEKRIAKRYRQIAKGLHPDALASNGASGKMSEDLAAKIIARIVNPSYQKLKHEQSRQEILSTVRLQVRQLVRNEKLVPTFPNAQALIRVSDENVDTFYEQALTQIAEHQFQSWEGLYTHSLEIAQLNLVFLSRKLEDLVIRPKRAGLISTPVTPTAANPSPISAKTQQAGTSEVVSGALPKDANADIDYVGQHTRRAKTYLVKQNYALAVQELREALKLSPQDPELHSLIGQAYYKQTLTGMAKSHFRQALKLKPTHKVALKYSELLGITQQGDIPKPPLKPDTGLSKQEKKDKKTSAGAKAGSKRAWFGKLRSRS